MPTNAHKCTHITHAETQARTIIYYEHVEICGGIKHKARGQRTTMCDVRTRTHAQTVWWCANVHKQCEANWHKCATPASERTISFLQLKIGRIDFHSFRSGLQMKFLSPIQMALLCLFSILCEAVSAGDYLQICADFSLECGYFCGNFQSLIRYFR